MMGKKAIVPSLTPGLVASKAATAEVSTEPQDQQAQPRRSPAETAPLNFRVSLRFKQQFRIAAAEANMNLTEFLTAMLDLWLREHRAGRGV